MGTKTVMREELGWMLASGWELASEEADGQYKVRKPLIKWCFFADGFWVRLFGHGISMLNARKRPKLCGVGKGYCVGRWRINLW